MSYHIEFQHDNDFPVEEERLIQAIDAVLTMHSQPANTSLTIVITDNAYVHRLNKTHRDVDAPTDILSFPSDVPAEMMGGTPYLGDLVIAYPYTKKQAEKHAHNLHDSLCLLVVHGCLHLLGYDHDTPEHKSEMWDIQERVLQQLDIDTGIVPTLEG